VSANKALDPRLHAFRPDLADARLEGRVAAQRHVVGRPARIMAGLCPVSRRPDRSAPIDTHYHYGEPVLVFAEEDDWAWCQSAFDRYVGYVEARALANPAAPTHYIATLGSHLYKEADLRSPSLDFLPRHAAVTIAETGLVTRGTGYARLDTGGFLPLACLLPQPPRSADLVAAARLYLGCPYLWAGKSFFGLDCSGLVQSAFRDLGVTVPRDTDLQRDVIGIGISVRDIADLRRGDLLYLPGHVLIHAGDGRVIHADGASMTVREDNLSEWLRSRHLDLEDCFVRRP